MSTKKDYVYLVNKMKGNGLTAVGYILRNIVFVLILIMLITLDVDQLIG